MAWKSHALKLGSAWIGGIVSQVANNDARVEARPTAGSIYPLQVNINEIKNGFRFTSHNVATALSQLGFLGVALGGGTAAELYEILWTDAGQIAAGSVHRKLVLANGRAVPRRLSCSHREDAQLEIEIFGLSDNGLNNPLTITESIALPTAVDDARHTILSGNAAGIDLGCIQQLDFDFGIEIESAGCKSHIFDTRMDIRSVVPKIMIQTLDANLVGTGSSQFPTIGKACTHANTLFQLRKRTPKVGSFVANATEQHITITCDGTVVPTTMFEGANNDDGTTTLEITGTWDGTNVPFVINPAAALT